MKKSLLALGALAALAGGVAHADVIVNQNSTGATLAVQPDGIGQILTVPYFSTQDNNTTSLNLVNTDTVNGKAVKVSFRGARNSDDLFDFYVYLSPGDVWNATIQQNADGFSELHSGDTSCTVPRKTELYANGPQSKFKDLRLPKATKGANETREGYVYFINTADIPPVSNGVPNQLWNAIKHTPTGGSPACGTLVENHHSASQNITSIATARVTGYNFPTTGLFANWLLLNVPKGVVNSGEATAIAAQNSNGSVVAGNFVLFPQVRQAYNYVDPTLGNLDDTIASRTADPVLRQDLDVNSTAQFFDFPDLSTPYVGFIGGKGPAPVQPTRPDPTSAAFGGSTTASVGLTAVSAGGVTYGYVPSGSVAAFQTAANNYVADMTAYQNAQAIWNATPAGWRADAQANELSSEFAVKTLVNEYINGNTSFFATDWVLSSPTRRYAVALDQDGNIQENTTSNYWRSTGTGFNSSIVNNTIVVNSIEDFSVWNREEVDSDAPVVSPFALPTQPVLPGEASVWRFRDANNVDGSNGGFVLGSDLITQIVRLDNVTSTNPANVGVGASFNEGWAQFIFNNTVPGSNGRLPVYGYASYSANGAFSIGATFNHRYTR